MSTSRAIRYTTGGRNLHLHDYVWCVSCEHEHIPTIPVVTYRCAGGPDRGCGFGAWGLYVAEGHATERPDHVVYAHHHQTVPLEEAPHEHE